jgi:hypothetical protein
MQDVMAPDSTHWLATVPGARKKKDKDRLSFGQGEN